MKVGPTAFRSLLCHSHCLPTSYHLPTHPLDSPSVAHSKGGMGWKKGGGTPLLKRLTFLSFERKRGLREERRGEGRGETGEVTSHGREEKKNGREEEKKRVLAPLLSYPPLTFTLPIPPRRVSPSCLTWTHSISSASPCPLCFLTFAFVSSRTSIPISTTPTAFSILF